MKKTFINNGFTLIELLTVLGIIGILTAAAFPVVAIIRNNSTFNNAVEEVANTLRVAQNDSLSSQGGATWGVDFDPANHQYMLFSELGAVRTYQKVSAVPESITFSDTEVLFRRLYGTTDAPITISITSSGKEKTIDVQPSGSITLE
ncbi:MAG: type II secretion system protein [Patescibacteria group bacterium]|nr:type II secretion system protein [Patescibacteria group bacterium]MDD5715244.1 type II secretion system protein [Patescibacteria group bacterium]